MDVTEATDIRPECNPWWESSNYSRTMHELLIGVIMAVKIYNKMVFEFIFSPLFLFYFGFGICELFLACRSSDDRNWIWDLCKISGRISHAIGSYIVLSSVYDWSDEPIDRYFGILFFVYFLVVILLCLCGLYQPIKMDENNNNNVADSTTCIEAEVLIGIDNHAENIPQISWWESMEFGRIMYELILGGNLVLIAHYHIEFNSYLLSLVTFLYFFLFEFGKAQAMRTLGRSMAQMIGVLTASYFIYNLISPVFALVLCTISAIWYDVIIVLCIDRLQKEDAQSELVLDDEDAQSELVLDDEDAQSELVLDEEAPPIS